MKHSGGGSESPGTGHFEGKRGNQNMKAREDENRRQLKTDGGSVSGGVEMKRIAKP